MTKILILFRAATPQLKNYISQIPLQLVYAIILANNKLEKYAEDFWQSFFFLLILVLPPFTSLDEMSGAVVVICRNKSQMLKDKQIQNDLQTLMTVWSWLHVTLEKYIPIIWAFSYTWVNTNLTSFSLLFFFFNILLKISMYMVYKKNKEKDKNLKGRNSLLFNDSVKK